MQCICFSCFVFSLIEEKGIIKLMKFGEYFQNVCAEHGASSIRKMSKLTSLGKSSVERIVAGECDIPSDKMVTHVAKITRKSKIIFIMN